MLERGEVDVMAGISYTEDRARVLDYPDYPMGTENYYIYVRQNSALASKDEMDMRPLRQSGPMTGRTPRNVWMPE